MGEIVGELAVEIDQPAQEACGLFMVHLRPDAVVGPAATELAAMGIGQLGHRGNEGTGVAVQDQARVLVIHGKGDAKEAFGGNQLLGQDAYSAMAHGRYATSNMDASAEDESGEIKKSIYDTIQPMIEQAEVREGRPVSIVQGHNGDIANAKELTELFGYKHEEIKSDSHLALLMLKDALEAGLSEVEAIRHISHLMVGAYSMTTMIGDKRFAWRDPWGFRPLFLGEIKNDEGGVEGWAVASEQPAFEAIGARELGPVGRGELVEIGDDGPIVHQLFTEEELAQIPESLCIFEFVYFARPDTVLNGVNVGAARVKAGEILRKEENAALPFPRRLGRYALDRLRLHKNSIVVGSPNSGMLGAEGYAHESGMRMVPGLVKNPSDGRRSFMQPGQNGRIATALNKMNVVRSIVVGNKVYNGDDSRVRGHTSRRVNDQMRAAGAAELHGRIFSPPYKHPCHFGMDTKDPSQLKANRMSVEEMRKDAGDDSLVFLSLAGLLKSVGSKDGRGFCTHCMTGVDPTQTPVQIRTRREYLERTLAA